MNFQGITLTTPLRRLDGITYWVIEDPSDIADFMNTQLRLEWVGDAKDEGRRLEQDPWLQRLPHRSWRLETVELETIRPDPYMFIPKTCYNFEERLAQRSKELRRAIESYGAVIWPITVRGEDMLLVDGYCRYTTLRAMNIPRVYAYVGKL